MNTVPKTAGTIFKVPWVQGSMDGFLVDTQTLWCCNVFPSNVKKAVQRHCMAESLHKEPIKKNKKKI